jgi:alpha-galactosidase
MRDTLSPILLAGLDPARLYRTTVIAGETAAGTPQQASGAFWMRRGLELVMAGDFRGAAIRFDAVAGAVQ